MTRACSSAEAGAGDPVLAAAAAELADTFAVAAQLAQIALVSVGQALSSAGFHYSATDSRIAEAAG
jgi:hypothetical protein